ncbi:MAG: Crp/Fnr family transcriptional regulator [Clostridiales bacterium]|nr:Crp/Fnr family transcriptional regulator [Clostridiales bacterium]
MEYFNIQEMGLPEDIWLPFARTRRPTPYRAGQLIYLQDTPADSFYYLRSGRVRTFISSEDGSEKVLTVYQAGNLFGEASFFDRLPRVSSAVAAEDCQVVRIGREDAARALADDPQLAWALLQYLARTVRMLSTHVDDMSFRPARQRVVRYLLSLPRRVDGSTACTQEEIAAAVGTSRVTVSRVVNRLAQEGLVETGYGSIRLLDPVQLQESLQE